MNVYRKNSYIVFAIHYYDFPSRPSHIASDDTANTLGIFHTKSNQLLNPVIYYSPEIMNFQVDDHGV